MTAAPALDVPVAIDTDPVVVLDRHPVTVTINGTEYRGRRVVVTRVAAYVFRRDGRAVALDLVAEYDPDTARNLGPNVPRFRSTILDLLPPGGDAQDYARMTIAPEEGCGCGSPLVGYVPWSPYVRGPLFTS